MSVTNQYGHSARFKIPQGLFSFALQSISMNGSGRQAFVRQDASQEVGISLGLHEYQGSIGSDVFQVLDKLVALLEFFNLSSEMHASYV